MERGEGIHNETVVMDAVNGADQVIVIRVAIEVVHKECGVCGRLRYVHYIEGVCTAGFYRVAAYDCLLYIPCAYVLICDVCFAERPLESYRTNAFSFIACAAVLAQCTYALARSRVIFCFGTRQISDGKK
jgi:hypothetical protein